MIFALFLELKILRGLPQPFYPDGGSALAASSVSNLMVPFIVGKRLLGTVVALSSSRDFGRKERKFRKMWGDARKNVLVLPVGSRREGVRSPRF